MSVNEFWRAEDITSGSKDDLFSAIITAENGTKLIAQVPLMTTALEIVREHNLLLPPQEWVCPYCEVDLQDAEHIPSCPIGQMMEPFENQAVEHSVQRIGDPSACWACGAEVGVVHEEWCPNFANR